MRQSRFNIAKSDIINHFNDLSTNVFSKKEISEILQINRRNWRLTDSLTVEEFIKQLLKGTPLKKHTFTFKTATIIRYSWGNVELMEILMKLRSLGYLSHYSAMAHYGLTDQIPKTVYLTVEQSQKFKQNLELDQQKIDTALNKPARLSNNFARYKGLKIYLLNGMFSNLLGVDIKSTQSKVTNIERTLIDITIRPEYSGGVFEVLKAYENAANQVSVNTLVAYLKKLNYIYPYHQCIGFYMMVSGKYSDSQLKLVKKIGFPFNFYLSHNIEDKSFSKEWNIYYPSNFPV